MLVAIGDLDGMDPLFPSSHRVSLVQDSDRPVFHDLPVVGSVPFGTFSRKERKIVPTDDDLRSFYPEILCVDGIAEHIVGVQVFDEHALRKMLDQAAVE